MAFSSKVKHNLFVIYPFSQTSLKQPTLPYTTTRYTSKCYKYVYIYKKHLYMCIDIHTPTSLNVYQNMPTNSMIITPSRTFKYLKIFKTLRNSVLHDNTLGEVGFMDQLFHKASYLKVATLAYAPFWVLQRQRGRPIRPPQNHEGAWMEEGKG